MYRQGLNILTPFWNWIYLSPFCPQFLNLTGTEYTKGLSAWGWLLGICYRQKRERNKVWLFISLFTSSRFYKLAISLNHRAYIAPFNSTLQCPLCLQVLETPPHSPASWLSDSTVMFLVPRDLLCLVSIQVPSPYLQLLCLLLSLSILSALLTEEISQHFLLLML